MFYQLVPIWAPHPTIAHDLGITNKMRVNRCHEPANPYCGYIEISDISGLPAMLGL